MKTIAGPDDIKRLIDDLADQIRAGSTDPANVALIGIKRRGDVLAQRLADRLRCADVGSIDITLYRDDLSETGAMATVGQTSLPFAVDGRDVVVVDDVIMTGRSILAAIREILDYGRPSRIRLAVLVERPEREIPIQPDHAAVKLEPAAAQKVDVRLKGQDDEDSITINNRGK